MHGGRRQICSYYLNYTSAILVGTPNLGRIAVMCTTHACDEVWLFFFSIKGTPKCSCLVEAISKTEKGLRNPAILPSRRSRDCSTLLLFFLCTDVNQGGRTEARKCPSSFPPLPKERLFSPFTHHLSGVHWNIGIPYIRYTVYRNVILCFDGRVGRATSHFGGLVTLLIFCFDPFSPAFGPL